MQLRKGGVERIAVNPHLLHTIATGIPLPCPGASSSQQLETYPGLLLILEAQTALDLPLTQKFTYMEIDFVEFLWFGFVLFCFNLFL
jgi:hypothetical protein